MPSRMKPRRSSSERLRRSASAGHNLVLAQGRHNRRRPSAVRGPVHNRRTAPSRRNDPHCLASRDVKTRFAVQLAIMESSSGPILFDARLDLRRRDDLARLHVGNAANGNHSMKRICHGRSWVQPGRARLHRFRYILDHHGIELDGFHPGLLRRQDAVPHILQLPQACQALELVGVQRVDAYVDPLQTGFGQRLLSFVSRIRWSSSRLPQCQGSRAITAHDLDDVLAYGGLTAVRRFLSKPSPANRPRKQQRSHRPA